MSTLNVLATTGDKNDEDFNLFYPVSDGLWNSSNLRWNEIIFNVNNYTFNCSIVVLTRRRRKVKWNEYNPEMLNLQHNSDIIQPKTVWHFLCNRRRHGCACSVRFFFNSSFSFYLHLSISLLCTNRSVFTCGESTSTLLLFIHSIPTQKMKGQDGKNNNN